MRTLGMISRGICDSGCLSGEVLIGMMRTIGISETIKYWDRKRHHLPLQPLDRLTIF